MGGRSGLLPPGSSGGRKRVCHALSNPSTGHHELHECDSKSTSACVELRTHRAQVMQGQAGNWHHNYIHRAAQFGRDGHFDALLARMIQKKGKILESELHEKKLSARPPNAGEFPIPFRLCTRDFCQEEKSRKEGEEKTGLADLSEIRALNCLYFGCLPPRERARETSTTSTSWSALVREMHAYGEPRNKNPNRISSCIFSLDIFAFCTLHNALFGDFLDGFLGLSCQLWQSWQLWRPMIDGAVGNVYLAQLAMHLFATWR
ncbi:hypothetical protein TESG_00276 [Trichophyton tonsurans CBS 112818]|uniref:Uncharacterized protein n=1 Tax=Trichophyton tonsurans (strain CBS 112818) TaxID=647933 RepID=F2RN05_TRIT1|nr:hypothetical protein TESG_00276 [Trichophyton tonsurans CBS 112818]